MTVLPDLQARWIDELLPVGIPSETNATCDNCAMCSADTPEGSARFFHQDTKCCTYEPALPNFIVGRILRDEDPAMRFGRSTVEQRMAAKIATTPWGLCATPRQSVLYLSGQDVFGRSPDLLCTHYQASGTEGTCGIWRHRNGVCASWHCKHVRGEVGLHFWQSLQSLLTEVEWSLGAWCVAELGGASAELSRLMRGGTLQLGPADLGGTVDQVKYASLWGSWVGRETDYYQRAADLVDPLDWNAVEAIGGVRMRVYADLVRESYKALTSNQLPRNAILGKLNVLSAAEGKCTVETYSGADVLRVPATLIPLLPRFDGRPTADTVARIATESGVHLNDGVIRKLVDFGLLREA